MARKMRKSGGYKTPKNMPTVMAGQSRMMSRGNSPSTPGTTRPSPAPAGNILKTQPTMESGGGFQTPAASAEKSAGSMPIAGNPAGQHDWIKSHFNPRKGVLR